jgi:hypothetical protein
MREIVLFSGYLLSPIGEIADVRKDLNQFFKENDKNTMLQDKYFSDCNETRDYEIVSFGFNIKIFKEQIENIIYEFNMIMENLNFYAIRIYIEYEYSDNINVYEIVVNPNLSNGNKKVLEVKKIQLLQV